MEKICTSLSFCPVFIESAWLPPGSVPVKRVSVSQSKQSGSLGLRNAMPCLGVSVGSPGIGLNADSLLVTRCYSGWGCVACINDCDSFWSVLCYLQGAPSPCPQTNQVDAVGSLRYQLTRHPSRALAISRILQTQSIGRHSCSADAIRGRIEGWSIQTFPVRKIVNGLGTEYGTDETITALFYQPR